ncbi:hypothetical protein [Anaplasma centrale]|nr:hypothetical protein [Anaplasma centrale]
MLVVLPPVVLVGPLRVLLLMVELQELLRLVLRLVYMLVLL